jgi:hypothetical protein
LVAPGGNPDADRFRPLGSGRSTSSLTNALLIQQIIVRALKRASAFPLSTSSALLGPQAVPPQQA